MKPTVFHMPALKRTSNLCRIGSLFFILAVLIIIGLQNLISDEKTFVLLTVLMLIYVGFEVVQERALNPQRILLNLPVLASIFGFALPYGFSYILFLDPNYHFIYDLLGDDRFYWLKKTMILAALGVFFMWRGYRSKFARLISIRLLKSAWMNRVFRETYKLSWVFIFICVTLSFCCRIALITLGAFGFSADYGQIVKHAHILQYLDKGILFGRYALFGLGFAYFAMPQERLFIRPWLIGVTIYEFIFGFLSGFKSQVVIPFIIIGITYYVIRGKLPKLTILISFYALVLAYTIIEPYRLLQRSDYDLNTKSVSDIASAMVGDKRSDSPVKGFVESVKQYYEPFLLHMSHVEYSARAIQYITDLKGELPENAPNFKRDFLMSPIYAVVPRFLWHNKPFSITGWWFETEVLGGTTFSSTAMGAIGLLYLTGGSAAVIIGYLALGILYRIVVDRFFLKGSGAWLFYLCMLAPLATTDFDSILVWLIRTTPVLIFAQHMLFRR